MSTSNKMTRLAIHNLFNTQTAADFHCFSNVSDKPEFFILVWFKAHSKSVKKNNSNVSIVTPTLILEELRLNKFRHLSSSDHKTTEFRVWKTVPMTGHAVERHWGMSRHWRQELEGRSWQKALHSRCQSHRVEAWGSQRRQCTRPASKPAILKDRHALPFVWQPIGIIAPNNPKNPCREMGKAEALVSVKQKGTGFPRRDVTKFPQLVSPPCRTDWIQRMLGGMAYPQTGLLHYVSRWPTPGQNFSVMSAGLLAFSLSLSFMSGCLVR